ncbi:uncharacterized protein RAG0_12135 [Rhynchosporium agropyri]|uniref:Uncharacterized protein n=1 Tax=Rhynchosporium agropyri TaxID=914238 RepID=A0A1E1L7F4_9HELO|nr:uncharacterized protein RAG0_12135 [Rhynchosporium agropyri]
MHSLRNRLLLLDKARQDVPEVQLSLRWQLNGVVIVKQTALNPTIYLRLWIRKEGSELAHFPGLRKEPLRSLQPREDFALQQSVLLTAYPSKYAFISCNPFLLSSHLEIQLSRLSNQNSENIHGVPAVLDTKDYVGEQQTHVQPVETW